MKIGIDVGGTNTDAVIMDGTRVAASVKSPTTKDISSGVLTAISEVLAESGIETGDIASVMIGTTHFINAFVERKRLSPVGIIRLSLPANASIPPLADWPEELHAKLGQHVYMLRGGNNFDGRPIAELDETGLRDAARELRFAGIEYVAISAAFSSASPDMELRAQQIVEEEIPGVSVTLSHKIGVGGLLARENAAIMNATLMKLSEHVVNGFGDALARLGIDAPFYISQNDGTLMNPGFARQYPILTFASGSTNSMRGAYFLSGEPDAIVADIGGTTTDFGALAGGYPRESSVVVDIGGVRTNFRMPDTLSIGLGGGSIVSAEPDTSRDTHIGPQSVGYKILDEALIFGGDTVTATDIAVAAGYADLGNTDGLGRLDKGLVQASVEKIHSMLGESFDRMKLGADNVPLILVGGGSILVRDDIPGASKMLRPEHSGVANAVGAAIAQVGADVEHIVATDTTSREAALEQAEQEVRERVVEAGGDPGSVQIVDIEEIQLAYMPGNTLKLRLRAVADLAPAGGGPDLAAARSGT